MADKGWDDWQDREKEESSLRAKAGKGKRQRRKKKFVEGLLKSDNESRGWEDIDFEKLREVEGPTISLYLNLNPEMQLGGKEEKGYVSKFHSLKHKVLLQRQAIETLPHNQRKKVMRGLQQVENFLRRYFVPDKTRTVVVFWAGKQLYRVIRLPMVLASRLVVGGKPFLEPLVRAGRRAPKILLVEIGKKVARLGIYHGGRERELVKIESFVPSESVDASRPGKVQRHRRQFLVNHLKKVADRAREWYYKSGCERVVILGEGRVTQMWQKIVGQDLQSRLLATVHISPDSTKKFIHEQIETALGNNYRGG